MKPPSAPLLSETLQMQSFVDLNHMATSSLNSLEYLTAITLGFAREQCENALVESEIFFSSKNLLDGVYSLSMAPRILFADIERQMSHLSEITYNYFEYVDTDLKQLH